MTGAAAATSSTAPAMTANNVFVRTVFLPSLALPTKQYSHSWSLLRLLFQAAVEQLLREFNAPVLEQLDVRLLPAIERHADRPGPGKRLRILEPRLVIDVVPAGRQGVALAHRQGIAVVIAGSVEPGQIVEAVHLDDKRVAVPLAVH